MAAFLQLDIQLDTYVDVDLPITILLGGSVFAGLAPASGGSTVPGVFTFRQTPLDVAPLLVCPQASGSFGVAPPAPVGAQCACLQELEQQYGGPAVLQVGAPQVLVATVATTAALAALATTGLAQGDIAFVTAGTGSYWAWSPADPNTAAANVVPSTAAGSVGNWLLWPTIRLQVPAAQLLPFVGLAQGTWDFRVQWANGTTSKLLEGLWYCGQSTGGH